MAFLKMIKRLPIQVQIAIVCDIVILSAVSIQNFQGDSNEKSTYFISAPISMVFGGLILYSISPGMVANIVVFLFSMIPAFAAILWLILV